MRTSERRREEHAVTRGDLSMNTVGVHALSETVEPKAGDARGGSLPGGYGGSKTATVLESFAGGFTTCEPGSFPSVRFFRPAYCLPHVLIGFGMHGPLTFPEFGNARKVGLMAPFAIDHSFPPG